MTLWDQLASLADQAKRIVQETSQTNFVGKHTGDSKIAATIPVAGASCWNDSGAFTIS